MKLQTLCSQHDNWTDKSLLYITIVYWLVTIKKLSLRKLQTELSRARKRLEEKRKNKNR